MRINLSLVDEKNLTSVVAAAVSLADLALKCETDDFFLVNGALCRLNLKASFWVPPYIATCVAISMSVLMSVVIS